MSSSLLQDRTVPSEDVHSAPSAGRRRRGRRRLPVRLAAAGVGLAVLIPVAGEVRDWFAALDLPFEQETIDHSTQPLLLALEDLAEYRAASATVQVLIDREEDTKWLPSVISGERVSFLATGTVDATVDFTDLDADRVTLSPDGESATIVLPAPRLGEALLDRENSRVVDRDRGLLDRLGGVFVENPTDDSEIYALAEQRLEAAAAESDVLERAEANTRDMLTSLARSLGVQDVEVTFEPAPGDGS